ncbi:LAQU0S04e00122g1_1 [Lachancea quebecensis]|uniref:LAQU0S04e00122g1_1 n=1 Tax=Lachancea quebecensis TaxID=1654605 RepID=A0A0P1KZ73_9SACH|nr:LAQU0S04e00122g1_1 [Lachancea quebecensis]
MPIEKDLESAYKFLYDDKDPEKALELYDSVLKQSPNNLVAHIYKAASLEKLYYGFKSWHSQETLENAQGLLEKALEIAQQRQNRSKQALVNFRLFVHYYNRKMYLEAQRFFDKARELQYRDDTLPIWEANLAKKVEKWKRKHGGELDAAPRKEAPTEKQQDIKAETVLRQQTLPDATSEKPTFKVDWYQSSTHITISFFTKALPKSKDDVTIDFLSDGRNIELCYSIPESGSEFQYSVKLSHAVDPQSVRITVLSKKLEVSFAKVEKRQWKQLESSDAEEELVSISAPISKPEAANAHQYPTSSKKGVDWSKLEVDDDDQAQSADAFFQQLYANSDPDTRRAMMKSYVESNGTALNTNWEEVAKKQVEAAPPQDMKLEKR